jgi:subtilisin family serine protease
VKVTLFVMKENLVCSNYYEMGVQKVWAKNITGKGVTIAIIDVGINIDLKYLKQNIVSRYFFNTFSTSKALGIKYMN